MLDDKLNKLQAEQINGYTINGKKWFGIKGVTKEIQSKITITVQNGLEKNKTLDEIKMDVKKDFEGFSDNRASLIARTETNKILNEGKLLGYQESGVNGGKTWNSTQPRGCKRCSAICDRLSAKYRDNPIPLYETFLDDDTGKEFSNPPAHPNCRSVISFRPL